MNQLLVEAVEPEDGHAAVVLRVSGTEPQAGDILQVSGGSLQWLFSGQGIISGNADSSLIVAFVVGLGHSEAPQKGTLLEICKGNDEG